MSKTPFSRGFRGKKVEQQPQPQPEPSQLEPIQELSQEELDRAGIQSKHYEEWRGSNVHPEIILLNVRSLSGDRTYSYVVPDLARSSGKVHPDAQWRWARNKYRHIEQGGWWCSGLDPLNNWEQMEWGCFKPEKPRELDGKIIKYEAPHGQPTRAFFLEVPRQIWERVAKRYNVELPNEDISFWQWVLSNPEIPIYICEGAKKAGCMLSLGFVAIAIPGVYNGYRQIKNNQGIKTGISLIPELALFAQENRKIVFAFDQDSKQKTKRQVNTAISQTAKIFIYNKSLVYVFSWDTELGKGIDDVVSGLGATLFIDLLNENTWNFHIWQTKQLAKLTYPVSVNLNSKYLGNFAPPTDKNLIALKAPKGTGKTEWLSSNVTSHLNAGGKILLLTHRIQLGGELCKRLGIDYISDNNSDTFGLNGYGLCINSLHPFSAAKFNPEHWEGAWIIIDECEQVFWSMLNSSLCTEHRVAILSNFQEAIRIALNTGGKVFLADADLSDLSIDYVQSLYGFELEPWIVENNWKPESGWNVYNYSGNNPGSLLADLYKAVGKGDKVFITCSAQKDKSKWGTKGLEKTLLKKFPHLRILRIDSESIADPNHPAYGSITKLNERFPEYDVVICSPTLETGVSITIDHFDSVWGIFQSVQPENSARQALSRVRSNVDRHIWCKRTGYGRIGNGSISEKELVHCQKKAAKTHIALLAQADFNDDIDLDFQPQSLRTWAKMAVRINMGMKAYREAICLGLEEEGHTIIEVNKADLPEAKEAENDAETAKEENYSAYCQKVAEVESPDDKRFRELEEARAKTEKDILQYRKGQLERRYLCDEKNPVSEELVRQDDDGWFRQVQLNYYFDKGRQFLQFRDKNKAQSLIKNGAQVFLPDFNRSQLSAKIEVLDKLNLQKILDIKETSSADPKLMEWANEWKKYRFEVKPFLGVTISEKDSPIAIAQKVLGLIGYRMPLLRKEGSRGNQNRIYGSPAADFLRDAEGKLAIVDGVATPLSDGREAVFDRWVMRDLVAVSEAAAKAEAARSKNGELTVVTPSKYIDITGGDYQQDPGVTTGGDYQQDPGVTTGGDYQQDPGVTTGEMSLTEQALAHLSEAGWTEASVEETVAAWGLEVADDAIAFCPVEVRSQRRSQVDALRLRPEVDQIQANAEFVLELVKVIDGDESEQREQWEALAQTVQMVAMFVGEAAADFLGKVRGLLSEWQWSRLEPLLKV